MTKNQPKMILNIQFENEELDKQIQIAMDKYVEDLMLKNLDSTIEKLVHQRITRLVDSKFQYSSDSKLNGKTLIEYVKEATNHVFEEAISQNIKDIFAKKIAEML